ncbi:MAG: glycosyltransferase family 4 protein [Desulfovibrio sp.]|jgi:glycosyltransferase involved in cell wall biosynthesis|nr:glycosyltransferase family 4 protein [Desulfovibrio sp.]
MGNKKIWASLHPFFEQGAVLGRREANRRFLAALIDAEFFGEYHFFLSHPDDCARLQEELGDVYPGLMKEGRFTLALQRNFAEALQRYGYYCLHLSDPVLFFTAAICLRNVFSRRVFPVTAPTHSLSYADYGENFLNHLWGGVTARDAVVGTSACGCQVMRSYYSRLRQAYGLDEKNFNAPSVRHIPLGVDPRLMPSPDEKDSLGGQCRRRYNLGDGTVFLVFARISHQSKMDLLPLLRACKRAEEAGLRPESYCLALAGWIDENDDFEKDILRLAANLGVCCRLIPRPDAAARKALYAAADIFLSPSDNLQETFGLTLLEAGLSSLPVVASSFDGYRDLVDDGENGILVSVVGPAKTRDTDCLARIVPAAEYHLLLAQQCAVDVRAFGEAMYRLAADSALRLKMGRAGRRRVLAGYTWRHIVDRYLALWAELNETPCGLPDEIAARPHSATRHPAYPSYMDIFSGYYTAQVDAPVIQDKRLVWSKAGRAVYRRADFPVIYRLTERRIKPETLHKVLFAARRPITVAALRGVCRDLSPGGDTPEDEDFVLLWALKHDLLEFSG